MAQARVCNRGIARSRILGGPATGRGLASHSAASQRPHVPLLSLLGACVVAAIAGCCTAPAQVTDALTHQLEDLALGEAELLPLVPADAVVSVPTVAGARVSKPARATWQVRFRGMMLREAALLAWAKGEAFDLAAAAARLGLTTPAEGAGDGR